MNRDGLFEGWLRSTSALQYFDRRLAIRRMTDPPLTRFLYKYRALDPESDESIQKLRTLLVHSKLWLSAPSDFNDPFDMSARIVVSGGKKELQKRITALGQSRGVGRKEIKAHAKAVAKLTKARIERDLSAVYETSKNMMGVYCFAGDPRDILMWSHYASEHKGLCIQFERARDFMLLSGALLVDYSDEYPVIDWVSGFPESLTKVLLQKSLHWKYEKEQRLIKPEISRTLLPFKPDAITAIIFGCRSTDRTREAVQALLQERKVAGLPAIALFVAKKHQSRYALTVCRALAS